MTSLRINKATFKPIYLLPYFLKIFIILKYFAVIYSIQTFILKRGGSVIISLEAILMH